jgi:hypothetical protein
MAISAVWKCESKIAEFLLEPAPHLMRGGVFFGYFLDKQTKFIRTNKKQLSTEKK